MLWPPPSKPASRLNSGSLPPPCDWNGPDRLMATGPSSCESPPCASILILRSSLPDLTCLEPVNVRVSRSFTSVLDEASSPDESPPPQAATSSASAASSDSRSAGRGRVIGQTGSCGGETNGRRLGCSTWRAGEASLASDNGPQTQHPLRTHCAPVHAHARRRRRARRRR